MSKNIIVCSDGTGQKGGYGADSNVYKLYKAVDLHSEQQKQITFYDNGVGTTEDNSDSKVNKLQRAISGGFGFGFQDNVCDLYRFLVKNYTVSDNIYFFGFSRGAATVRACVGFINICGLLDRNKLLDSKGGIDSVQLEQRLHEAMETYEKHRSDDCQAANQFKRQFAVHDDKFAPEGELKIHFVGVWDTVSALGFSQDWSLALDPIFTCLDVASDQIWPHRFYRYGLNKNIHNAYQALAIDDARKTFHPKVWNETKEAYKDVNVEQVWFPGVHSNVGGGYPRTGLSDVAFDWMMTRAKHHGLALIVGDCDSVKAHANPNGKLFNSRDGLGIYYRYDPRNLTALCHSKKDGNKLCGAIKIHHSAIERMEASTAKYAPSYLPAEFEIVDTDLTVSAKKFSIKAANQQEWKTACDTVNAWVAKRKMLYHAFMEISLFLIVVSGLFWVSPPDSIKETKEAFFLWEWIFNFLTYITPVFFENFITYVVKVKPFIFVGLIGIAIVMFKVRRQIMFQLQQALEKVRELVLNNLK